MEREEHEIEVAGLLCIAHGYMHNSESWMRSFFELEELTCNGEKIDLDFYTNWQIEQIEKKVEELVDEQLEVIG